MAPVPLPIMLSLEECSRVLGLHEMSRGVKGELPPLEMERLGLKLGCKYRLPYKQLESTSECTAVLIR